TERQRSLTRERNAATRATLTSEGVEKQRILARERSAARRAALTPEEIERQRSLTRERNAVTRATLTPKEVERQRELAAERTMVIRATASPKVAEEHRILARKRSVARRANYTTEEVEQQRALARKRSRLQSNLMQKQVPKKKETSKNAEVEWPKPADMECKTNCLKKFIQQMSMNSLAEGVSSALQWLRKNNPLYRSVVINQSTIDKLPDDDVPECLWATMQVSTNVEASESERASYIPDPLLNASEYNNTAAVPLIPSAVLDVNGTNISTDDVAEHLLERMKAQITDKTRKTDLEEHAPEDPVYMIPRGNKPVNEYSNPNLLLGIFPTLFPYGCGAVEDFSRPVKIDFHHDEEGTNTTSDNVPSIQETDPVENEVAPACLPTPNPAHDDFERMFRKDIVIDKSDRRLLKNTNGHEGERLCTEGTKMNERHTFASAHPQSSSHIIIKRSTSVVPVLLGPQIPRREREETYERYCRTLLTLFVPWRNGHRIVDDMNTFVIAHAHHARMIKEWKRDIETRRDQARSYLISGEDTLEVRDDDVQVEVVTSKIPTSPFKAPIAVVPPAPILVFRNTLRTQINNRAVLNKAMEMGHRPIVCVAQDYINNTAIDDVRLRKAILELPDNKAEHLPGYLPLVPGMPVLLTENIATELGLSNGTRGIFRQLVYDECFDDIQFDETLFPKHTKFITQPKYALVEFSSCKPDCGLNELETKVIPISVSEQTFLFDIKELLSETVSKAAKMAKQTTKISIKRKALPLIPAYSIKTHKSQGQTLGKIIVDLVTPPGPVEVASIYVPLSRVKRLDDLLIVRPFEFSSLQVKPSAAQLQELKRLDMIAKKTQKSFASFL
ncbi:unnamed protein product, partial [Rotaria sp. Silwood1]